MHLVSIDFEFRDPQEKYLDLVCCSYRWGQKTYSYWLFQDDKEKTRLVEDLLKLRESGVTFLAWNVVAEARSFISLGLRPLDFKWYDPYLEYRCLLNHNHRLMYGKQLIKGKLKHTRPPKPKWERTEEDQKKVDNNKPEYNLVAAAYKLLGKHIDNEFKKKMRDVIIKGSPQEVENNKDEIMRYCDEDVIYLEPMFRREIQEYKNLLGRVYESQQLQEDMAWRAEYACRTAMAETTGYPIDVPMVKNFSQSVGSILWECQKEIVELFPENPPFHRRGKKKHDISYSLDTKAVKEEIQKWLKKNSKRSWMKTDTGDISLSKEAFDRNFSFKHNYPKDNYFAQIIRYLNLKQNLNGFLPKKPNTKKETFWDYVGSDGFVRPYMGIYGAQSGRSQPKATGFIPLKSSWMRCMISPPPGKAICGIDYKSQEYLLSAIIYRDLKMLEAYKTGDVYLAYGKDIKYIPPGATKKSHGAERQNCKAVVLGLSYDMTEFGLAKDLSVKFGRTVSPEEALKWIEAHKKVYKKLWKGKERLQRKYRSQKYLRMPDGWFMWGDNPNFRSVGNVPVQGFGASIMRKAVQLAQDRGLDVIYTLHDALYIMFDSGNFSAIDTLADCMYQAFIHYFYGEDKEHAKIVGLDADIWSPDYEDKVTTWETQNRIPVKQQQRYIDERGEEEYQFFKRYFEGQDFSNEEF